MRCHNFDQSMDFCKKHELFAYPLYKQVFGGEPKPVQNRFNQIGGCDVAVESFGKIVMIEEKIRKRQYGDVFLEHISAKEDGKVGWIEKNLLCDYLSYIVLEDNSVTLFPFALLRQAWKRKGEYWKSQYGIKSIPNHGIFGVYTTLGVCVPIPVIWAEITKSYIKTGINTQGVYA